MTAAEQTAAAAGNLRSVISSCTLGPLLILYFKRQGQKSATKHVECRGGRSVSRWFNSLARNYNSPVTKEKKIVLTKFSSHFHRLLCNKTIVLTFQD